MNYVAIKMLIGDTSKYIGIIIGVTFAALIMTQQPSIFVGLMTRTFSFISDIPYPKLWIMDPKVRFIDDVKPLRDTELLRARSTPGIAWAVPLLKSNLRVKLSNGSFQNCIIIGIDDATLMGGPNTMLSGKLTDLHRSNAIIVDSDGAAKFLRQKNKDGTLRPLQVGDTLEINDNYAVVVGIAQTTMTFQRQPTIYMTYSQALEFSPTQRLNLSFILAGIQDGVPQEQVIKNISEKTDMIALTGDQFKDKTLQYYIDNTGIPINFGTSVALGFLVGAAIAGQMFFNFTHDNIRQFGTLKAMGASNCTLVRMILLQAFFVGATGFGLGTGLAALFGYANQGGVLAFRLTWEILLFSALGVLIIMIIAALISIRKVVVLEPAIVFKS